MATRAPIAFQVPSTSGRQSFARVAHGLPSGRQARTGLPVDRPLYCSSFIVVETAQLINGGAGSLGDDPTPAGQSCRPLEPKPSLLPRDRVATQTRRLAIRRIPCDSKEHDEVPAFPRGTSPRNLLYAFAFMPSTPRPRTHGRRETRLPVRLPDRTGASAGAHYRPSATIFATWRPTLKRHEPRRLLRGSCLLNPQESSALPRCAWPDT
jgi:hypothetical protein